MKKLLLIVFLFSFSNNYANNWLESIEEAQKLALGTNKLILVDFWASWCGPCKKMDRESWSDDEVKQLMENYVPVKINIDRDRQTPTKFDVRSIPDIFILNGNGDIVYHKKSYMSKNEVLQMLREFALETSFMQQESINYYKQQSYNTAFMLGKKYLDYSLYLEGTARINFLHLAEKYLKESRKLLDKQQSNYTIMDQKIALLELVAELYSGNSGKVFRKLEKGFSEEEIATNNKRLYYYVNYCCSKATQSDQEQLWFGKLTSVSNHEIFLKKAELLYAEK